MKTRFNLATLLLTTLFCSGHIFSAENKKFSEEVKTELITTNINSYTNLDHTQWNELLKNHVTNQGVVDYEGFKKDVDVLDAYLKMLSLNEPSSVWSVQELLAYYINLYNAGTVKLVLENYPVKSIKDINRPWGKDRIAVGKKKISLDGIEHDILRKMNEPRIHFALNCASISCPKLLNEAYTAGQIYNQLERVTKKFINSDKNDISALNPKISSLFDWYKKDFMVNGKADIIAFINIYSTIKINPNAKISYMKYDWNLNGK